MAGRSRPAEVEGESQSNTTVLATPSSRAHWFRAIPKGAMVRLSGIVRLKPRQEGSREARNEGSSLSATSCFVYDHCPRPSARYAASCNTGDSECAIGLPNTAHRCISFIFSSPHLCMPVACPTALYSITMLYCGIGACHNTTHSHCNSAYKWSRSIVMQCFVDGPCFGVANAFHGFQFFEAGLSHAAH